MGAVAFAAGGSGAGERTVATVTGSHRPKGAKPRRPKGEGEGSEDGGGPSDEDDVEDPEEEADGDDIADAWPPVFEEGDEHGPVSVPFYRLDAEAEIEGDTALLREAKAKQAAGDSRKASATEAATRRAMGRLDEPPAAAQSKSASAAACLPSFLPPPGEAGRRIVLLQLPGSLPIAPAPEDGARAASSSSSSAAGSSGDRERRSGPPTIAGAASLSHSAATDPELTPAQRAAIRTKAAAQYNEAVSDPDGAAAGLRALGSGRIGEMRVRRSGRCELVIGDAVYEIARGVTLRQAQEVVKLDGAPSPDWRLPGADLGLASRLPAPEDEPAGGQDPEAAADPSRRAGRLLQLGLVSDKLVATPLVDDMIQRWTSGAGGGEDDEGEPGPAEAEAEAGAESDSE